MRFPISAPSHLFLLIFLAWQTWNASVSCGAAPSGWPSFGGTFDIDTLRATLEELERSMAEPAFWD